jgi:hypothetical protein
MKNISEEKVSSQLYRLKGLGLMMHRATCNMELTYLYVHDIVGNVLLNSFFRLTTQLTRSKSLQKFPSHFASKFVRIL